MFPYPIKQQIVDYILERHCREKGGFCFYRLEEPSGADTYYSIWILQALNQHFSDERTISYLENFQHPDGSYDSIFSAFYSINGLRLLNERPRHDSSLYILGKIHDYHIEPENVPTEITSILKRLLFLLDIYMSASLIRNYNIEKNIRKLVYSFQNKDGGFGHQNSSLYETAQAVQILQLLDCKFGKSEILEFIEHCERPDHGFTDVPNTTLSYIEYIHAGLKASLLVSYKPKYLDACDLFIKGCQRRNGGYSRSTNDGISTIENTYLAVHSLLLLSKLRNSNK